jgi:hypothetical protein
MAAAPATVISCRGFDAFDHRDVHLGTFETADEGRKALRS